MKKIIAILVSLLACFSVARAHDPGLSSATVVLQPASCAATLIFSKVDAAILLDHFAADGSSTDSRQIAAILERFAASAIAVQVNGEAISPANVRADADEAGNISFSLTFASPDITRIAVTSKWIGLLPPGHRQFVSVERPGGIIVTQCLLSVDNDSLAAAIAVPSDGGGHENYSFAGFVAMGVQHICTGYDHLLFLFGLLAVTRSVRGVIGIITCFTLAHSVTLALAALHIINLSSGFVEPAIAASIVFVGAENFLRGGEPKGRRFLTLLFGLVHGFGFASALEEAGVGQNGGGIVLPLFSFNLGIELGQLTVAAIALPLIWWLRSLPSVNSRWIPATSVLIAAAGSFWFLQRVTTANFF